MTHRFLTALVILAAVGLMTGAAVEAKFSISLGHQPTRPVAGQPLRMVIRTSIVLPRKHGLRLAAVGPWRDAFGQTFFDVQLVRAGPHTFTATIRFPYAGRWRLIVPNWGGTGSAAPAPLDRYVRVRPRR